MALLIMFCDQTIAQKKSKSDFSKSLQENLENTFNISYLPSGFFDCGYEVYLTSSTPELETGYQVSKKCLPQYFDQLRFSDKGVKMMASFEDAFVNSCVSQTKEYEQVLYTGRYCKCLHEQYVKYEIGFDHLMEPGFQDTEFFQKVLTYCYSIHEK